VYPNPTDGKVWVCGDALARVSVLDAMGRVVLVKEGADGAVALDLSSLPDGLYLLHVASLKGLETHRVLLCR
ncbi:MAG: T9SS type A sorting domain-containing protein, partial [Bacteroidales bacterium]|nr:T9SS type A sorting domain-containing protein [Bacteroidales bacterium]MCF0201076.1 T9SS type A sorting domain-containing protein [Bacteroidales bacterium]MCF0201694.1 T9SS type A sorting domain-containing protein [Bacteroidales bacterium]